MSTTTFEENSDFQDSEENLRDLAQHASILSENKPNPEDLLSISSEHPSPVKDVQPTSDTKDTKVMELITGQSLIKSGILAHLQLASPLESVTELVEVEEACDLQISEEPIATKEIFPTTTVCYMSLTTEGLGHALEGAAIFGKVMESNTQPDLGHPESPMTEACSSVHEIPVGSWLQEDSSKISVIECQQVDQCPPAVGGFQKEAAWHQLTTSCANSGVLELTKHSSVPPLEDLITPQEVQMCHQTCVKGEDTVGDELRFDRKPNSERFRGHIREKEATATNVANQSLIEVLTACEAKVEQYEQLRSSSFDLSAQLRSAQLMADSLHQRMLSLEHEHSLKDKKLQELTTILEKTSETLQARNWEMATITNELQQLHLQVEAQKNVPDAARTITANGLATPDPQLQLSRSSKICTLL
ncbi:hypothetical protein AMEX_G26603 [Astyanax mexicanus]|uniref:Uncharacterized protein n=1 Tax=Astyanax mexicanus TaxID=7994 RepID=A0A8T2KR54_ASTMX|nr:hypothetical protein AMEX_G26603 [Astyanax mexicanus]